MNYIKEIIPSKLRQKIMKRDGFTCQMCQKHIRECDDTLTIDHIFPEVMGGDLGEDNLRALCRPCNSRKSSRIDWSIVPDRFKSGKQLEEKEQKEEQGYSPRCVRHGCGREATKVALYGPYCEKHFLEHSYSERESILRPVRRETLLPQHKASPISEEEKNIIWERDKPDIQVTTPLPEGGKVHSEMSGQGCLGLMFVLMFAAALIGPLLLVAGLEISSRSDQESTQRQQNREALRREALRVAPVPEGVDMVNTIRP